MALLWVQVVESERKGRVEQGCADVACEVGRKLAQAPTLDYATALFANYGAGNYKITNRLDENPNVLD